MNRLARIRTSAVAALTASVAGLAVSGCALFGTTTSAVASGNQLAMLEVPNLQSDPNPGPTLTTLRSIGVNVIRVDVLWNQIAPDPTSRTKPPGFTASDPSSYPSGAWDSLDRLVSQAQAAGIQVDLMPMGGAPLWATASGAPGCTLVGGTRMCFDNVFEPSASEYGQFVHAVATHYPSVHFWEVWNETNWGPSLAPQYMGSSVPVSANLYRGMLDAAWSALQQTGHGHDTVVDGSLSQDGSAHVGQTGTTAPLVFVRTLYCVDASYKQLRGAAARQAGCPTSKTAFRNAHPALFSASGMGVHPYPYGRPPTQIDFPNPNGAEFAEIPHLITTLQRVAHTYGSHKPLNVYNTEFGYQTGFANAQNAAKYINQAEYISWKNPRIATYDQYELQDVSWFATGLVRTNGGLKPSFYAYRLPVWLPVTTTKRGSPLEVWGDVRPAHFATADGHGTQYASIQFSRGGSGSFQTIKTVPITNSRGYFDVRVKFTQSGAVRLAWRYPTGDSALQDPLDPSQWIYSRVTSVTVR
jgi:hypothetical protein